MENALLTRNSVGPFFEGDDFVQDKKGQPTASPNERGNLEIVVFVVASSDLNMWEV